MKAVILIGGKGERLMPLIQNTRKAFLPLGDKRIIDHIIDRLPEAMPFSISENDSGAIAAISEALPEDNTPIMVIGGDNYFSDNLDGFISTYAGYTLVGIYDVKSRKKAQNLGVVELHSDGKQISRIIEKSTCHQTTLVSTCLYIFPPEVFNHIRNMAMTKPKGNVGELIHYILALDPVYGYFIEGVWFDIGTKESYEEALSFLK